MIGEEGHKRGKAVLHGVRVARGVGVWCTSVAEECDVVARAEVLRKKEGNKHNAKAPCWFHICTAAQCTQAQTPP